MKPAPMRMLHVPPGDLSNNPWNTNVVGAEQRDRLRRSMERHGWVRPIVARRVDGALQILGGQHRVEIAAEMGMTAVPVVDLGEMTDQSAKEIGLLDNARYGEDDALGLAQLLSTMGDIDELSTFLPSIDAELAALMEREIDFDNLTYADESAALEKPAREAAAAKTHQVMRFKVAVEDADFITDALRKVQHEQGFVASDALTNAGDALVWSFQQARHEG